MCAHRSDFNPALVCDRRDAHDEDCPGGHTYTASNGSHIEPDEPTAD